MDSYLNFAASPKSLFGSLRQSVKRQLKEAALKQAIRALRHRNFKLFFGGQIISLVGTWMQRIAMGWLVYRLTNSPFMLGAVGFAGQIPTFLLALLGGVSADRWDRRRVLVVAQTLAMVQALLLSVLVLTGTAMIWQIFVLSMFLGIVNAWDMPVRQSFMIEMVEKKEDLSNAIVLNSSMVNSARLLGPSLAGILIAAVGEGTCFLLNGISYLVVIAALLAMNVTAKASPRQGARVWRGLYEDQERAQAMRDAGTSDYKTKGCAMPELISAIRDCMQRQ